MCCAWRHAGHPCMASEPDCASGPQQASCRRESDRARAGHSGGYVCAVQGAGMEGHRAGDGAGGPGSSILFATDITLEAMVGGWRARCTGRGGPVACAHAWAGCGAGGEAGRALRGRAACTSYGPPPQQALFLIPPMATHAPPMVRTQPACMHGAWMGVRNTGLTVAGRAGEQQ